MIKRSLIWLTVICLAVSFVACSPADNIEINSLEELKLDSRVISIEKVNANIDKGSIPYEMFFESNGLKLNARIVVPKNYTEKALPVVFYFPEVSPSFTDVLDLQFAQRSIAVVSLSIRGTNGSEGVQSFGGEETNDALTLIDIFKNTEFFKDSPFIVAGSGEGSITALRTASACDDVDGCAVVDCISNVESFIEARGDGVKALFENVIGSTEEYPEEYKLRSAMSFADKIDVPLLILYYKSHPLFPESQATSLYNAVIQSGGKAKIMEIDALVSDFHNDLAWTALRSFVTDVRDGSFASDTDGSDLFRIVFESGVSADEQSKVKDEISKARADIEGYFGVALSSPSDAISYRCVFDSKYSHLGNGISTYLNGTITCTDYKAFVHEYVHLLLHSAHGLNTNVTDPIITEGIAKYTEYIFDDIRSEEYEYIRVEGAYGWGNEAEEQQMIDLAKSKFPEVTDLSFNKAMLCMLYELCGANTADMLKASDSSRYKYYLGALLAEHLIEEKGVDTFVEFYKDTSKAKDIYGKDLSGLINEALEKNRSFFRE